MHLYKMQLHLNKMHLYKMQLLSILSALAVMSDKSYILYAEIGWSL